MPSSSRAKTAWYSIGGERTTREGYTPAPKSSTRVKYREKVLTSRRVRFLREEPYTQKEAEAAVGLRTDNGTRESTIAAASAEQPAPMEVEDVMNQ